MILLLQGTRVSETTLFRHSLKADVATNTNLVTAKLDVIAYRGNDPNPKWLDVDSGTCAAPLWDEQSPSPYNDLHPDMYSKVCTVTADVRSALRSLPTLTRANGEKYLHFVCHIELLFGLTEHQARLTWEENVSEHLTLEHTLFTNILLACRVRRNGEWHKLNGFYLVVMHGLGAGVQQQWSTTNPLTTVRCKKDCRT